MKNMKKQKGFTLIELMVVMAIIAILATAGLSAYTGYIKKARDATRIEDLRTLNTIVVDFMSSTGRPPVDAEGDF
jgi:type IV pilus assembly protein PilA